MRAYHAYTPDQAFLLPPSLSDDAEAALDAISPDDPVHIVRQVVHDFDLSAIHRAYQAERGRPPFHPEAMVGLLLYGACRGIYSSRRLAQACRDHVAFMYLTGRAGPDFHTIAQFPPSFRPVSAQFPPSFRPVSAQFPPSFASAFAARCKGFSARCLRSAGRLSWLGWAA